MVGNMVGNMVGSMIGSMVGSLIGSLVGNLVESRPAIGLGQPAGLGRRSDSTRLGWVDLPQPGPKAQPNLGWVGQPGPNGRPINDA